MKIGVPKEIKNNENRVALTPEGASVLIANGHSVYVEQNAGIGSGYLNESYERVGAILVDSAEQAWQQEIVIKVKEPISSEYKYFRKDLILFTYLHLAAEKELTDQLLRHGVCAIAYETVQLANGTLPLLTPMSEVAGRMSVQIGAHILEKHQGGKGILLGGVPGVRRGKVTIIGGGVAGTQAAKVAVGFGADVTILDVSAERLAQLDNLFGRDVQTLMSNPTHIAQAVTTSDLVIGAVLIPGAKAPKLVSRDMVSAMEPGSVVIDIAVDQGGIFETTDRITSHDAPTYSTEDVIHYAVPNMPGAVPRTATMALTNVTLPYLVSIANKGLKQALEANEALAKGLNTFDGKVTNAPVANVFLMEVLSVSEALKQM
ncbi:MAG: alanine dehydrogenase [Bacilli bacterium]